MAEMFPRMKPGDKFDKFSAGAWNRLCQMGERHFSGNTGTSGEPPALPGPPGLVIEVRNDSGADRDRFEVLGLADPLITPADSEEAFLSHLVLKGVKPVRPSYTAGDSGDGRFVVLQEPLAQGEIARCAMLAGVSKAKVDVVREWHFRADIIPDDPTQLRSYAGGSARILWKESGTGTKWAVVQYPVNPVVEYDGTLDGSLVAGGSATLSLWRKNSTGTADENSSLDETVYAPFILPSGSIAAGKRVSAIWKPHCMQLVVNGREC